MDCRLSEVNTAGLMKTTGKKPIRLSELHAHNLQAGKLGRLQTGSEPAGPFVCLSARKHRRKAKVFQTCSEKPTYDFLLRTENLIKTPFPFVLMSYFVIQQRTWASNYPLGVWKVYFFYEISSTFFVILFDFILGVSSLHHAFEFLSKKSHNCLVERVINLCGLNFGLFLVKKRKKDPDFDGQLF